MFVEWIDKNTIKIRIEKDSDLISLFKIINPGDVISGYDYRTIKLSETRKERIKVWIKMKVERVKFSEYEDSLRVSGRILETSDVVTGKYHTFNLKKGSEFKLYKRFWTPYEISELERAQKVDKKIYIISIDDREVSLGIISNQKVRIIENFIIDLAKDDPNRESVFIQKISRIIKILNTEKPKVIIIVGPMYYPDIFEKNLKEKFLGDAQVLKFKVSKGGKYGIYEFLRRKEYLDALKDVEIAEVNKIISDFLEAMVRGYAVFGLEKIKEYADMGNLEFVIVSYRFFKKIKEEGNISELLNLFKRLEQIKSRVFFAYEENENFDLIDKFGVVGKVRYKIE